MMGIFGNLDDFVPKCEGFSISAKTDPKLCWDINLAKLVIVIKDIQRCLNSKPIQEMIHDCDVMAEGTMDQIGKGWDETNLNWFNKFLNINQPFEKIKKTFEHLWKPRK